MIPFEFVVEGIPVSLQAKSHSKVKWKQKVTNEAFNLWIAGDLPTTDNVQVTILYFYDKITGIDVDNMLKPILDALKGLVYVDDGQITDVIGRKREIHGDFTLWLPSPLLLASIKKGVDFVCVQVEIAT